MGLMPQGLPPRPTNICLGPKGCPTGTTRRSTPQVPETSFASFAMFYPPSGTPDSKSPQKGLNSCRTTSSTWTVRSAPRESWVPLCIPRSSGSGPCPTRGRLFAPSWISASITGGSLRTTPPRWLLWYGTLNENSMTGSPSWKRTSPP